MTYAVRIMPAARRQLNGIPARVQPALLDMIAGPIAENPHRVGRALALELAGLHAARRHDYRIIYEIDDGSQTVRIVRIQHRRDAYRTG